MVISKAGADEAAAAQAVTFVETQLTISFQGV
jgi:hypothetical protein